MPSASQLDGKFLVGGDSLVETFFFGALVPAKVLLKITVHVGR